MILDRAFFFVAPKLWNGLPYSVRNAVTLDRFEKNLMTIRFKSFAEASNLLLNTLMRSLLELVVYKSSIYNY